MLDHPYAVDSLLRWVNLFAQGAIPNSYLNLLLSCLCRPLAKESGGIRPIVLFDCLLKLATGCVLDYHSRKLAQIFHPHQFGAGLPAGTDKLILCLKQLASIHPDHIFVASDIKNAFGTVRRSFIANAVNEHVPTLSHCLLSLWSLPTTMNIPVQDGWCPTQIFD